MGVGFGGGWLFKGDSNTRVSEDFQEVPVDFKGILVPEMI